MNNFETMSLSELGREHHQVDLRLALLLKEKRSMIARWTTERIPTPAATRAQLDESIAQANLEKAQITIFRDKRRQDQAEAKKAKAGLPDHWQWSDQAFAALTHLCEANGQGKLVQEAKRLVAAGWPFEKKKGGATA